MRAFKQQLQQNLAWFLFAILFAFYNPVIAEINPHAEHQEYSEQSEGGWHGVYFGFIPCQDCPGIKATLSLNKHNNYLLTTQKAQESTRENYEKGKYIWDDEKKTLTLTPRKGSAIKQYLIEENTLVLLDSNGRRFTGKESERYILNRSDTAKTREFHFH